MFLQLSQIIATKYNFNYKLRQMMDKITLDFLYVAILVTRLWILQIDS